MTTLLAIALLPPLVLMVYVYQKDKVEREPLGLVLKVFVFGALSTFPAMVLELLAEEPLQILFGTGGLYLIAEAVVGIALIEECCKLAAIRPAWKSPEFNYTFDGIVYCAAATLGFAALENVFYVFQFGVETGFARAFLSVPMHLVCGIFVGYYVGLAKQRKAHGSSASSKSLIIRGLAMATAAHGFYDYILNFDSSVLFLVAIVFAVLMDVLAIRYVRRAASQDSPVDPQPPVYEEPQDFQF